MENKQTVKPRRKGIYLVPNLLTTGTLFGGFYAIVMATAGHFDAAVFGIFGAMIADGLDGRVARLTNTQTDFGKEYDRSEEHTSELQSLMRISYAVFCLKK